MQVFGRDDNYSTSHGIYDVLSDALLDLVETGLLSREFYQQLIFPIYFRSLEELIAPLEADTQLSRLLHIDKAESIEVEAPFNRELERTGDVPAWASSYTNFLRAFTESIIAGALPDSDDIPDVIDSIYQRVEQLLISKPDRYPFHYISLGVLISKSGGIC